MLIISVFISTLLQTLCSLLFCIIPIKLIRKIFQLGSKNMEVERGGGSRKCFSVCRSISRLKGPRDEFYISSKARSTSSSKHDSRFVRTQGKIFHHVKQGKYLMFFGAKMLKLSENADSSTLFWVLNFFLNFSKIHFEVPSR